jgi:limonene-1,2-epoxide hydrolase
MHESIDDMTGADAVCKAFEPAMAAERVEWEVSRSHTIGSLVINERIDKFYGMPDGKGGIRDVIAGVAGFFHVTDGKIAMWRDYSIPGSTQD